MKQIIVIIAFLFMFTVVSAQPAKLAESHTFKGVTLNNKKEGEWIEYYSNGLVSAVYNYKNGKLDGDYVKYDEYTHQVLVEGSYKNCKKDGVWYYYQRLTAFIDSIITYNNGKVVQKI